MGKGQISLYNIIHNWHDFLSHLDVGVSYYVAALEDVKHN